MKKTNIYSLFLLTMLIGIVSAACGTEGEESEPKNTEFTIPWPEGGDIITENWDDTSGHITVQYDNSQYETVVDFYDDYTSGGGWNRSEIGQGNVPTINYMNLGAGKDVSIDPPNDQISGAFLVTLTDF